MRKFILIALAATAIASAASVQAAERPERFDGVKFFDSVAARTSH